MGGRIACADLGPRFSAYVVAAEDAWIFTLGRLPTQDKGRRRAEETAARLTAFLGDRRMTYGAAGHAMGRQPNSLRYAAPTGTVLMRWDGARQPVIWAVQPPDIDPAEARLELARRYLHLFGPETPAGFARWAGIKPAPGHAAFEALKGSLVPVRTPIGDAWILATDEPTIAAPDKAVDVGARLLPSGDAYFLLWGANRELLVREADRRRLLWTSRVWPGAVLVDGAIVGTWRRATSDVAIELWRPLSSREREAVEVEAESLPLPGLTARVRWAD
ncbi:MAG TPA: crosslink repair DNA glycosylase YcaQ family protein [Candidatus Limnocylindrales bacterium]|nr:crosslink repair DNA glycosylase YcaQ family protein [Candidatus Limnocylindrales bacterium]